jgi:ribonuclease P protein component
VATNAFPKSERLSRRKHIQLLFARGNSFLEYPLRVVYLPLPPEEFAAAMRPEPANEQALPAALTLFSVSKKRFKRAVDRNLLKRRMREAYRLNKSTFLPKQGPMLLAFQYIAKEELPYAQIERKLKNALLRLACTTS